MKRTDKLTYTVAEAAQALGVSRPVVYELCNRADFPSIRVSAKRIVIPIDALEVWLQEKAVHKDA